MWPVVILTLSLLASVNSYTSRQQPDSAASEAQIRFAVEKKYDDTGPGAKEREYAYKTYRTLENALVNYLDDPDTVLPDHEREKALNFLKLQNPQQDAHSGSSKPFPRTVEEYNAYAKQSVPLLVPQNILNKQTFQNSDSNFGFFDLKGLQLKDIPQSYQKERVNNGYSLQKIQSVKGSPVSLAHYTRGFTGHDQLSLDQFNPNPQYSFSYGVHARNTGDTKSAQEMRADGAGVVRGFYSFVDADGRPRTVHYTADDEDGFKAKVQRTYRATPQ